MTRTYTRITGNIVIEQKVDPNIITQTRTYQLITPLFGGGAETQKPDAVTTVRASEVRGHLRFWWRATQGGMFGGDLKKMKDAEEKIWGSAAKKDKPRPSVVMVRIKNATSSLSPTKTIKRNNGELIEIGEPGSPWGYVAFPLKKNVRQSKPAGSVVEEVKLEVELKYPNDQKLEAEIEEALWAWETFGGIGARTRRGFGSLLLTEKDRNGNKVIVEKPHRKDVRKSILSHLEKYIQDSYKWDAGVPHLPTDMKKIKVVGEEDSASSSLIFKEPKDAWKFLFDKLKEFRQERVGYGRSHWPEPDAIRRLPGMTTAKKHSKRLDNIDKFPRAQFGLPIIFKFKDGPESDNPPTPPDPPEATLQGAEHDRLASPLIIRPMACSDGAVGVAAILEWGLVNSTEKYTPPHGLKLESTLGNHTVHSDLLPKDLSSIRVTSLKGKSNDILQAFLDYLK